MSGSSKESGRPQGALPDVDADSDISCGQGRSPIEDIFGTLIPEMTQALSDPRFAEYERAISRLDDVCVAYILKAFSRMGWEFEPGGRFSKMEIISRLGIVDGYQGLLERLLEILVEEGVLRRETGQWEAIADPADLALKGKVEAPVCPEAEAEIALLAGCGPGLADVLQGKCSPLSLLFPEADMSVLKRFYRDSPSSLAMNGLIEKLTLSILDRFPQGRRFRILEVGAGTGGTASRILRRLGNRNAEYLFTDVAHLFLNSAKEEFEDYPFVRYGILDIEREPQSQGVEPRSFDLIIAVNALHGAADLRQALRHIRETLSPGGVSALVEASGPMRWVDLTFGLTSGWWRFRDRDVRPSYPLISPVQWKELLKEEGFVKVSSVSFEDAGERSGQRTPLREALIIAQKPHPEAEPADP